MTNGTCKNCGKPTASTRAGSITSYFFQHNYCHCKKEIFQTSETQRHKNTKDQARRICTNCGKARPIERRLGSFTSFLFKELRCQCAVTSIIKKKAGKRILNSGEDHNGGSARTQTASRAAQKRQLTTKFKEDFAPSDTAPTYFAAGTIIGGAFEIVSIIGEGGMGVVYLAQHTGLNKFFALKVLTPNLVNEQSWLRFQAEARILSSLNHSSIVKVYDLGIHAKTVPFYSMDYLNGRNLEEILCQRGPLPLQLTLSFFMTMLDGLAYAHRNGIVHRDIKPANIFICSSATPQTQSVNELIDDDLEVKILDFGISKLVRADQGSQHLTSAGEIFGSPFYMSPEQCRGGVVDARSDIYSVGCALFETLTGLVPFEGKNGIETSMMHEEDEPPLLAEVLPDNRFPPQLDMVIAKCLAKLPQFRYQSAKELAIDLARIQDGKKINSSPSNSTLQNTPRTIFRDDAEHIGAAGPVFGLLALAIVGIIFSFPTIEKLYINRPLQTLSRVKPKLLTSSDRDLQASPSAVTSDTGQSVTTVLQPTTMTEKQSPSTAELSTLTELFSNSAPVIAYVARRYEDKKMWKPAIECGDRALALFKTDSEARVLESPTAIDFEDDAVNHYTYSQCMGRDFEGAIKSLTKSIVLHPTNYWFREQRALAYRKIGKFALAAQDEKTAAKLKASVSSRISENGRFLTSDVSYAMRHGDMESAVIDAGKILSSKANDIYTRILRARCFRQVGQYKQALKDYNLLPAKTKAIASVRAEIEATALLAKNGPPVYGDLALLKTAGTDVTSDPQSPPIANKGYMAYVGDNTIIQALKNIRSSKFLQRDRSSGHPNLWIGVSDMNPVMLKLAADHKGDYRVYDAICSELEKKSLKVPLDAELSKLLLVNPDNIGALASKIATSAALQNWQAEEKLCSNYINLFARGADPGFDLILLRYVYSTRATARRLSKNFAGAVEDQTVLLKLTPDAAGPLRDRAGCYMQSGQYEQAVADYSKYIKLKNAKSGTIFQLRAQAYEKLNKFDLAKQDMEKAKFVQF